MAIKIDRFILCDDIRVEKTNKLIIIGMYADNLIRVNEEFPYNHPILSFYFDISGELKGGFLSYKIIDPNGNVLFTTPLTELKKPKPTVKFLKLQTGINNLRIPSHGDYKIEISINNEILVQQFKVVKGNTSSD